jgi:hypothetical protein
MRRAGNEKAAEARAVKDKRVMNQPIRAEGGNRTEPQLEQDIRG